MMFLFSNYLYQILNLNESVAGEMGAMTFGGITGYSAGYALKKIFKIVIIITGTLFVLFQVLSHYDILVVNWGKIQSIVQHLSNNETNNFTSILTKYLPLSGGFAAGFILGFKKG